MENVAAILGIFGNFWYSLFVINFKVSFII